MEVERKILGNTLLLAAGQFVAQLANFGFVILFARSFGASALGVYSLAMAIGALSSIFVSFGTNSLALKEISRDLQTDREVIGRYLPLQILAGVAVWSVLSAVTFWLYADRGGAGIIIVVALFHVVLKWQALLLTRFQSRQSMQFVAMIQAGIGVGILILGGLTIYAFHGAMIAVACLPISATLLLLVVYFVGVSRFGPLYVALRPGDVVGTIKKAWPFLSILILTVLYGRLGVIFLRIFQSDADVGYFASAERLLVPFTAVFAVFIAAVFPALSRIPPDRGGERDALAQRFLRSLLALVLPAATLMYLYRGDIIFLLYGADFKEAVSVMTILSWAIALRGFNTFLSMFSIAADLQARVSVIKLFTVIVFVVLAVSLIPIYSYTGLAYAIIASEFFLALMMYWSVRQKGMLPGLFNILWRPAVCCVIAIVVTMNVVTLPLAYRLLLSLATIITAAFLTGAVKRHDLGFLLRIASSRRTPDSG